MRLFTSVDDFLARPIAERLEGQLGLRIELITDTEATKTTGVMQRLIAEYGPAAENSRGAPRPPAVWWSNEALGSIVLAERGMLVPFDPREEASDDRAAGAEFLLRDTKGRWHASALRCRVIAYHTGRLEEARVPVMLRGLLREDLRGKIGMARPQFGTTRMHFASLVASSGIGPVRALCAALKEHGVRLYSSNSAVVRGISQGEVSVGLTDTDDVWAGQANKWPVACVFESAEPPLAPVDPNASDPTKPRGALDGLVSTGPMFIPTTVGVVARAWPGGGVEYVKGVKPEMMSPDALSLARALLSAEVEEAFARGESGNMPVRASLRAKLAGELPRTILPDPVKFAVPDAGVIAGVIDETDAMLAEVFGV